MTTEQATLRDALNSALSLEHSGHDYYVRVAENAKNPLTREVFNALAAQELLHMERIQDIYHGLQFPESVPHVHADDMQAMVRGIFARFSSHERQTWEMDNAEAYEYASDLERQSIAMYNKLAADSNDAAERQFFEELSREENAHLNALENVYNYLQRTGDWFASDESHVWNWMNT